MKHHEFDGFCFVYFKGLGHLYSFIYFPINRSGKYHSGLARLKISKIYACCCIIDNPACTYFQLYVPFNLSFCLLHDSLKIQCKKLNWLDIFRDPYLYVPYNLTYFVLNPYKYHTYRVSHSDMI